MAKEGVLGCGIGSNVLLLFVCLIQLQCRLHVVAILDPIDFLALQSIRKALEDMSGSNFFSSWDFTSNPCNFAGVYCDSDKVIAFNLGDSRAGAPGRTGWMDPTVGKLSGLTEFTVVPGRIYGTLPKSFSQLKNLRFLGLSRNYISSEVPETLDQELRGVPKCYVELLTFLNIIAGPPQTLALHISNSV